MTFKMTDTNRVITVYNLSPVTNEFIDKGNGYIPANAGLPAYCTDTTSPVVEDEFIAVFNSESGRWSLVEDHRGKIIYNIHIGANTIINRLDKLPGDVVSVAPEGHFVKQDGEKWVYGADAEKTAQITQATQQEESLLALAASKIVPLQDAVDLGIATEAEAVPVLAWKKYRILFNRIKPDDVSCNSWSDTPDKE